MSKQTNIKLFTPAVTWICSTGFITLDWFLTQTEQDRDWSCTTVLISSLTGWERAHSAGSSQLTVPGLQSDPEWSNNTLKHQSYKLTPLRQRYIFSFLFNPYCISNIPIEAQNLFYKGVLAKIAAQNVLHTRNKATDLKQSRAQVVTTLVPLL